MKKEITYKELQKFDNAATAYLVRAGYFTMAVPAMNGEAAKPGAWTTEKPTKLVLNIKNLVKQASKHFEEYSELRNDICLDNCLIDDKTKAVLYNENGSYQFSKDGLKKTNQEIKDLSNKTIEIHTRITEGDFDLTTEEKEAFSDIVIPEFTPEEETD